MTYSSGSGSSGRPLLLGGYMDRCAAGCQPRDSMWCVGARDVAVALQDVPSQHVLCTERARHVVHVPQHHTMLPNHLQGARGVQGRP